MPTWSEILKEVSVLQTNGDPHPYDVVRRKYLGKLSQYTERDTILYATRWIQPGLRAGDVESIIDEDLEGLMEVAHGLKSKKLDIILHSPGGSAEATEAMVSYLRKKFEHIRVIVPHAAMSAATMWACSANEVVMGKHSFLGPIDPQIRITCEGGQDLIPAQAILDQFDLAKEQCSDSSLLNAWLPMLKIYGPALLIQCQNAIDLSQELVKQWLQIYMFADRKYPARVASRIARALADHRSFKSHGRHLDRDRVRKLSGSTGLVVSDLESDQTLQDLVLSVYHSSMLVFGSTSTAKIIENQNGRAFIKAIQLPVVSSPVTTRPPSGPGPIGTP